MGRYSRGWIVLQVSLIYAHGSSGFMVKVSNQHGSRFHIKKTIVSSFHLLQSRRIECQWCFCRCPDSTCFGPACAAFAIAVKWYTAILGVHCSIMSEE